MHILIVIILFRSKHILQEMNLELFTVACFKLLSHQLEIIYWIFFNKYTFQRSLWNHRMIVVHHFFLRCALIYVCVYVYICDCKSTNRWEKIQFWWFFYFIFRRILLSQNVYLLFIIIIIIIIIAVWINLQRMILCSALLGLKINWLN